MKKIYFIPAFFLFVFLITTITATGQATANLNTPVMNAGPTANGNVRITVTGDDSDLLSLVRTPLAGTVFSSRLDIGNEGSIILNRSNGTGLGMNLGTMIGGNNSGGGGMITFSPMATERVRIAPNGFVGINTAAPTGRLHVLLNNNENVRFQNLPNGSGNLLVIDDQGNVTRCPNATCSEGVIVTDDRGGERGKMQQEIEALEAKIESLEKIVLQLAVAKEDVLDEKEAEGTNIKDQPILFQNRPNPSNGATVIDYYLPENSKGISSIEVYTITGQLVETLEVNGKGFASVSLSNLDLPNGTYFYKMVQDGKIIGSKKMIITK